MLVCVLSCLSLDDFRLDVEEHTENLCQNLHASRRHLSTSELCDVCWFQVLYSFDSCIVNRHNLGQRFIAILFDNGCCVFLFFCYCGFTGCNRLLSIDFLLFNFDNLLLFTRFLSCNFELWNEFFELLSEIADKTFSLVKLSQTSVELVDFAVNQFSSFVKQCCKCFDQDQVRSWCNVVVSAQLESVLIGHGHCSRLHVYANLHNSITLWQIINIFEEFFGD